MGEQLTVSDLLVYLVEPSRAQSVVLRNFLNELGVQAIESLSGAEEALRRLAVEPADLVISAMHLPDGTGAELIERMRGDPHLRDVAFVLVTSETDDRYLEPVRQSGAAAILPKPYDRELLAGALRDALELISPLQALPEAFEPESMKVLVADDSAASRAHIRKVLTNLGFEQIREVGNGAEAAALAESELFDLVVTDFHMPVMDGCELARHLRARSLQPSVPILMVSSEQNPARIEQARQAGVSAVCPKPFAPAQVRELLGELMAEEAI